MRSLWKFILPIGILLVLAGCVAPQDGDVSGDQTKGEPVVLGALGPLSGDGAVYGVPLQRVAELAVADVNENGGVNGKQLKLAWEDGGCNADTANRSTQKLLTVDNVSVIFGGFCSSETLAAAPQTEAKKAILFSAGSSSPDISNAGDFVFRNYPSDSTQGSVLAEYAKKQGYKKVGVVSEQQDYTLGIKTVFEESFDGTVMTETYSSDSSDFRTQILKLKGANVDVYFINVQSPPKGDLLLKQLQEQGVTGPFILNDVAIGFQDNITKYAEYLEGGVGAEATYDRSNPGVAELQAKYKELYNEELPYMSYMTTTWDAIHILAEAVEAAGDVSKTEAMRDYFYGIKGRKGLAGSLTMDKNGDPMAGHVLRVVKAGKVEDLK